MNLCQLFLQSCKAELVLGFQKLVDEAGSGIEPDVIPSLARLQTQADRRVGLPGAWWPDTHYPFFPRDKAAVSELPDQCLVDVGKVPEVKCVQQAKAMMSLKNTMFTVNSMNIHFRKWRYWW